MVRTIRLCIETRGISLSSRCLRIGQMSTWQGKTVEICERIIIVNLYIRALFPVMRNASQRRQHRVGIDMTDMG